MIGDSSKITFQIKVWAFIGPFFALLSLLLLYLKMNTAVVDLPLLLIVGIPLCWRWRLTGFFIAAVLLGAMLSYNYATIPLEDRFWQLGLGFSMLIAFLITALCYEEVEAIVNNLQNESRSRLESIWKLDEKQRFAESELKNAQEEITELQGRIRSYRLLVDTAVEQLAHLRSTAKEGSQSTQMQALEKLLEERLESEPIDPHKSSKI